MRHPALEKLVEQLRVAFIEAACVEGAPIDKERTIAVLTKVMNEHLIRLIPLRYTFKFEPGDDPGSVVMFIYEHPEYITINISTESAP